MASESMGLEEDDTVFGVVGVTNIPEAIRCRDTLAHPDYADLFTATTSEATSRSAEEWARSALEETATGRSAPFLWRRLGLRLGPTSSPDFVQGWRIADRGDGWIRLETASWFMTAHAVIQVDDGHVSIALYLRYDQPIAAFLWPPVSVMHRRAVPVMLRQALKTHAPGKRDISLPAADRPGPNARPTAEQQPWQAARSPEEIDG